MNEGRVIDVTRSKLWQGMNHALISVRFLSLLAAHMPDPPRQPAGNKQTEGRAGPGGQRRVGIKQAGVEHQQATDGGESCSLQPGYDWSALVHFAPFGRCACVRQRSSAFRNGVLSSRRVVPRCSLSLVLAPSVVWKLAGLLRTGWPHCPRCWLYGGTVLF